MLFTLTDGPVSKSNRAIRLAEVMQMIEVNRPDEFTRTSFVRL